MPSPPELTYKGKIPKSLESRILWMLEHCDAVHRFCKERAPVGGSSEEPTDEVLCAFLKNGSEIGQLLAIGTRRSLSWEQCFPALDAVTQLLYAYQATAGFAFRNMHRVISHCIAQIWYKAYALLLTQQGHFADAASWEECRTCLQFLTFPSYENPKTAVLPFDRLASEFAQALSQRFITWYRDEQPTWQDFTALLVQLQALQADVRNCAFLQSLHIRPWHQQFPIFSDTGTESFKKLGRTFKANAIFLRNMQLEKDFLPADLFDWMQEALLLLLRHHSSSAFLLGTVTKIFAFLAKAGYRYDKTAPRNNAEALLESRTEPKSETIRSHLLQGALLKCVASKRSSEDCWHFAELVFALSRMQYPQADVWLLFEKRIDWGETLVKKALIPEKNNVLLGYCFTFFAWQGAVASFDKKQHAFLSQYFKHLQKRFVQRDTGSATEQKIVNCFLKLQKRYPTWYASLTPHAWIPGTDYVVDLLVENAAGMRFVVEINGPTHYIPYVEDPKSKIANIRTQQKQIDLRRLGYEGILELDIQAVTKTELTSLAYLHKRVKLFLEEVRPAHAQKKAVVPTP